MPIKVVSAGTNIRVSQITYEISEVKKGLFNNLDFVDWSEDFDIIAHVKNYTVYFNLKFICVSGGQQNRSIKLVANMIYYLAKHIDVFGICEKRFVFITDGEYLMKFCTPTKKK